MTMKNAQDYFFGHFRGSVNAATPVVVEYGWLEYGRLVYELSSNKVGNRFGLTVLDITTNKEARHLRQYGTEQEVRSHIPAQ